MNLVEKQTLSIRTELLPFVKNTTVKTYFSYYGIFKDGLMFGLYKDDKFYLKISHTDLAEAQKKQLQPLVDIKLGHIKNFYYVPKSFIASNATICKKWINSILAELHSNKIQMYQSKKTFIRSLPNMSLSLERMLKKVNIHTIDDLIRHGEINTFVELIKLGFEVDKVVLFRLYGAIHHKFIYTLSLEIKQDLLKEADHALYQSGLRKRFTIK